MKQIFDNYKNSELTIALHEVLITLDEICKAASYVLKHGGTFAMVHRPDRLVDILEKMRKEKIEPKEITFVYPKINKEPNLILIKGVKNGKAFFKINKPLYVYDEDGNYTDEILKIYGKK